MKGFMRLPYRLAAGLLMAVLCTPAHALDPLTLFLLRVLRDKIISAGIEASVERATIAAPSQPPVALQSGLPLSMDDTQLRQLIDEGFVHLTTAQRGEVYQHVRRILRDPKNAVQAPAIVADLAVKASAVRQAHEALNKLPMARKRQIAAEAREEYERMPLDTREELAGVLRARVVPMPADLTDMILAEFDRVRVPVPDAAAAAAPVATPAAAPATVSQ